MRKLTLVDRDDLAAGESDREIPDLEKCAAMLVAGHRGP